MLHITVALFCLERIGACVFHGTDEAKVNIVRIGLSVGSGIRMWAQDLCSPAY